MRFNLSAVTTFFKYFDYFTLKITLSNRCKLYSMRLFFYSWLIFLNVNSFLEVAAQDKEPSDEFRKYDLLPAISYSPETALTLGVIGYRYLQLGDKTTTNRSFINFLAVYTTKQQTIAESNWDIFLKDNKYRFRGAMGYNQFPDRNYGLGNNADALVREFDLDNGIVTDMEEINYLRWSPFEAQTDYFQPSEKSFMINYRVQNIEALVEKLKANGVQVVDEIAEFDYGKFVRIMDPEGNKIELWEPVDQVLYYVSP